MKIDCKDYAVKLLAVKDRTEKELRDKLVERHYMPEEIDAAIESMASYGYINDRAYAEKYLRDGLNVRGHGEGRIKTELLRRGVSREIVEEVLSAAEPEESAERMGEIFDRRFGSADLSSPKERNRIFGYFARRGFAPHEIWSLINRKSAFKDIEYTDWEE